MDDRSPEDNAGAAHLDTVEFNSSTLYRYATVCVSELADAMNGDVAQAVCDFVDAFIAPCLQENRTPSLTVLSRTLCM